MPGGLANPRNTNEGQRSNSRGSRGGHPVQLRGAGHDEEINLKEKERIDAEIEDLAKNDPRGLILRLAQLGRIDEARERLATFESMAHHNLSRYDQAERSARPQQQRHQVRVEDQAVDKPWREPQQRGDEDQQRAIERQRPQLARLQIVDVADAGA